MSILWCVIPFMACFSLWSAHNIKNMTMAKIIPNIEYPIIMIFKFLRSRSSILPSLLSLAFAFFCLVPVFGPAFSLFNIIIQWHQILVPVFDPLLDLSDLFQPRVILLLAFAHHALPFLGQCTVNCGERQMSMFCGTLIQTHWSGGDVFTFPLSL